MSRLPHLTIRVGAHLIWLGEFNLVLRWVRRNTFFLGTLWFLVELKDP